MGDGSMSQLDKIPHVIDYAHSEFKSEFVDVYLGATSKFNVATSSGYMVIPEAFGVPIILTNCIPIDGYYGMTEKDLFLPKLILNKATGKALSFEAIFSFPICGFTSNAQFEKHGLIWKNNTAEELNAAVIEMIDRLDGTFSTDSDSLSRSEKFKVIARECAKQFSDIPIQPLAHVPKLYLKNHSTLFN